MDFYLLNLTDTLFFCIYRYYWSSSKRHKLRRQGIHVNFYKKENDQHREGHTSTIAFTGTLSCPVNITQRLLSLLPGDKDSISSIVRRIGAYKKRSYFQPSLGISYSTGRDLFKEHITPFTDVPSRFSTGWKNRLSKRRYVKYSTSDFLEVSRRLGLRVWLSFKDFSPPMSVCIGGEARSRFFAEEVLYGFSWPAAPEVWSLRLSCVQFIVTFLNNFDSCNVFTVR